MGQENENYLKKELYNRLKKDSTFFDFIQEGSLDGLWYWNLEKIDDEWMSPKFWEVLGYDPKEKKHNPKAWQDIIFKEDFEQASLNLKKHCEDPNHPYDQTVRYRHKNGSIVWIRCRGIALRDKKGKAIRMLGAHTDITDIKQTEKALNESERRQKSIVQSLEAGVVIHAPDGTVIDSNARAQKMLGLSQTQLTGKTATDPVWVFVDEDGETLPIEKYPVNLVLETKKIFKNRIIGVVQSTNKKIVWVRVNGVPIFDSFGHLTEVVISFVDVTEVMDTQSKIADSESRFRKLFEQSPTGYQSLDHQGYFLEVNEKWLEILGYSKEEVIGQWFGDFLVPKMKAKFKERFELFKKKGFVHTEFSMKTKQGAIIQVGFDGKIAYDENRSVIQTHCTVTDMTEINITNEKLEQSEEKYRTLHDTMIQGVIYRDNEGNVLSCNPAAEKLLGLSLEQMQGNAPIDPNWKIVDQDGEPLALKDFPVMVALRTKKKVGPLVGGVYHPDNDTYVWLNISAIPLFKEGEKSPYQVYTTLEDITDKRNIEKDLVYQRDLMAYIIQHMNSGVAVHDKDLNYLYVSEMYKSQYHVDDAIIGRHHYDVFPDLPEKWRKVHQRSLKGEIIRADRDKFVHEDGRVDWTQWESRPWYDNHGDIGGIIIYTKVINQFIEKEEALKELNKELQQSEEQYRLLTNEMQLGLALHEIICDEQGNPIDFRFLSVNKSWETLMGLKKEDVLGKKALEVFPNTEKSWIETFGEVALNGTSTRYENYATELKKYLNTAVYSPKKGQFAVVVEDITEKRKQEEVVKHALRHDSLTDIPNRLYYDEKLIELDCKENYPLAVIMMDINGLKLINDSFGQEAGNMVLKQFAAILRKEKQEEDFIARISGDEFVMLCPRTSYDDINQLNQRLIDKVSLQRVNNIEYSIAIGFAVKKTKHQETSKIVTEAENARHRNKIVYGQGTRSAAIDSVFSTLTNKYAYEKVHSQRVAKYSKLIGKHLSLRKDEIDELELAGRLHDIGKIAIHDDIIMKPGSLTSEEWRKIKDHTVIGYQILRAADKYSNLAEYAMSHHERIDGKGYPNGLKGDDIPLFARIISVADAYEAMTADRTYRKAIKKEEAIKELKKHSGTQFDAAIVDVFIHEILPTELV